MGNRIMRLNRSLALRALGAGALLLLASTVPARAQQAVPTGAVAGEDYNIIAGWGASYMQSGALNPGTGAPDVGIDPGMMLQLFGEVRAIGDIAWARVTGGYSNRPFSFGSDDLRISSWLLDLGLVLRPLPIRGDAGVSPFIAAGAGVLTHAFGRSGRAVMMPDANAIYPGNDQTQWQLSAGAGIDVVPRGLVLGGTTIGVRLEVADHVTLRSQFTDLEGKRLGPVHNVRAGVSVIGLNWF
jgi:hypothetical protein